MNRSYHLELLSDHLPGCCEPSRATTFMQGGARHEGNATLRDRWTNGSRIIVWYFLKAGLQISLTETPLKLCG